MRVSATTLRRAVLKGTVLKARNPFVSCLHNDEPDILKDTHTIRGKAGDIVEVRGSHTGGATFVRHAKTLVVKAVDGALPRAVAIGAGDYNRPIMWFDIVADVREKHDVSGLEIMTGCMGLFAARFVFDSDGAVVAGIVEDMYVRDKDVQGAVGIYASMWREAREDAAALRLENFKQNQN